MREITTTLYSINELQGKARERAMHTLSEWQADCGWWENVYHDATEIGTRLGFSDMNISFSGFWSQGDGASFTGTWKLRPGEYLVAKVEEHAMRDKVLSLIALGLHSASENFVRHMRMNGVSEAALLEAIEDASPLRLYKSGPRYEHEFTVDVDDNEFIRDLDQALSVVDCSLPAVEFEELRVAVRDYSRDFMRWIYNQLQEEYEYLTSEENLIEFSEANEYEFTKDGEFYRD